MQDSPLHEKIGPALLEQVMVAAGLVRAGGVAAYPTDTVYGLGADVFNIEAVSRVFSIKQRPLSMPLPVLIAEHSQLAELVGIIPDRAKILMDKFWPGALTIVFNKAPGFTSPALAGSGKIAIRLPGHPLTLRLIQETGHPIVGTSANLHGRPAALTAGEVREQLGGKADIIIDGGRSPGGIESTVVDITARTPVILRGGAIPAETLAIFLT